MSATVQRWAAFAGPAPLPGEAPWRALPPGRGSAELSAGAALLRCPEVGVERRVSPARVSSNPALCGVL